MSIISTKGPSSVTYLALILVRIQKYVQYRLFVRNYKYYDKQARPQVKDDDQRSEYETAINVSYNIWLIKV